MDALEPVLLLAPRLLRAAEEDAGAGGDDRHLARVEVALPDRGVGRPHDGANPVHLRLGVPPPVTLAGGDECDR